MPSENGSSSRYFANLKSAKENKKTCLGGVKYRSFYLTNCNQTYLFLRMTKYLNRKLDLFAENFTSFSNESLCYKFHGGSGERDNITVYQMGDLSGQVTT